MRGEHIDLRYRLRFRTPFHFGTGLRAGLTHRAIARAADGFLYVPGSTLKGVLRDKATQIAGVLGVAAREPHNLGNDLAECAPRGDIVTVIFGSRWRPGGLAFDDARLQQEDRDFFRPDGSDLFLTHQTETRTQVSMSRVTGTARRGLLFSSEYGIADLCFEGRILGQLDGVPLLDDPDMTYSLILLLAALQSVDRLGGNRSAGAGLVSCETTTLRVNGEVRVVADYLERLVDFELYSLVEEDDNAAADSAER